MAASDAAPALGPEEESSVLHRSSWLAGDALLRRMERRAVAIVVAGPDDSVKIAFDPIRGARRVASADREAEIDASWRRKCATNARLFDGRKFRLAAWHVEPDERGVRRHTIQLGLSGYREYLGTNAAPDALALVRQAVEAGLDGHAFLASAVGIGTVLETRDGFLVVQRRSQSVGESPGEVDTPGGHPEPDRVLGADATTTIDATAATDTSLDAAIWTEVLHSASAEVEEELGVPRERLTRLRFLGASSNPRTAGRVSFVCALRFDGSAEELAAAYAAGLAEDAFETTSMQLVRADDVRASLTQWLRTHGDVEPGRVSSAAFLDLPLPEGAADGPVPVSRLVRGAGGAAGEPSASSVSSASEPDSASVRWSEFTPSAFGALALWVLRGDTDTG